MKQRDLLINGFYILFLTSLAIIPLYHFVDLPVAIWCKDKIDNVRYDNILNVITDSDDIITAAYVIAAIYALCILRSIERFKIYIFPPICCLIGGVLANVLKPIFGRLRPKAYFGQDSGYGFEPFAKIDYMHASFPSAHTLSMMTMLTALALYYPRWRILFISIALLIGASRVLLCAHYLSDVVAGAVIGYLLGQALYVFAVQSKFLPNKITSD